jgi:hypothetical protein
MADDVATRFEVPISIVDNAEAVRRETEQAGLVEEQVGAGVRSTRSLSLSLAQLFDTLSTQDDFSEYTVEQVSLESVFLKVIREHNVREENPSGAQSGRGSTSLRGEMC